MAKGLDPDRPKHYQLVMVKGVGSSRVLVHKVERGKVMEAQNTYVHVSDVWQMKASAQRRALKKIRAEPPPPTPAPTPEPSPEPTPEPTPSIRTMTCYTDAELWWKNDCWTKYLVEADVAQTVRAHPLMQQDYFYLLRSNLFSRDSKEVGDVSPVILLLEGSILDFDGDAIVNAANTRCLGGGGIDGAINARGGEALVKAREELPLLDERGTRCEVGDAKVTIAGDLKCKYVIHAVGPNFGLAHEGTDIPIIMRELVSAYRQAMLAAKEHKMKNIAFCILSGGIYRGNVPLRTLCAVAWKTIAAYLYDGLERVYFYTYTEYEKKEVKDLANSICMAPDTFWQRRI